MNFVDSITVCDESDNIFATTFHPSKNFIACGFISGYVRFFDVFSSQLIHEMKFTNPDSDDDVSVRSLFFTQDGSALYIAFSTNPHLLCLDLVSFNFTSIVNNENATDISCMQFIESNSSIATGHGDGFIHFWDMRCNNQQAISSFNNCEDYISAISVFSSSQRICAANAGDGTIGLYDFRKNKVVAVSNAELDDELLSLALIQDDTHVLAGSGSGVIYCFDTENANLLDIYDGHTSSVDLMNVISPQSICTGCEDGFIRLVSTEPYNLTAIIADHSNDPVQTISVSSDRTFLASSSYDPVVRFWDLDSSKFKEVDVEIDCNIDIEESEDSLDDDDDNSVSNNSNKKSKKSSSSFFDDL